MSENSGARHDDDNNSVRLVGRISAAPQVKTLPSGDEVVSFRLIVRRPASALRRSKQLVDTIECSVWTARLQRRVLRLEPGSEVVLMGALRRRFSRGSGAAVSFVSVEVVSCQKVVVPAVTSGP